MNKILYSARLKSLANEKNILRLLIIYGVAISLVQFLANRSLWIDEAMVSLNIIHRSPAELLKPLNYAQSAPPLFLIVEKLFSTLIPNSEYGLRLFPMLCFWMTLFLFVRIARKQRNIYAVCIIALTLFVTSRSFLRYSNEVKQYMTDALVFMSILWIIVKDYKNEQMKYWSLGIAGFIAIYLSNVAPVILATSGIYLCYKLFFNCDNSAERNRKLWSLSLVFLSWMVSALIYYWFFVHGNPWKDTMMLWWGRENGFFIVNPFDEKFADSITNVLSSMFSVYFLLYWPFIGIKLWSVICVLSVLYISGIIRIIKYKKTDLLILYCLPLILHLTMSALHFYPFAHRLVLYTFPCTILVCSLGIQHIIEIINLSKYKWFPYLYVIPFLILAYTTTKLPIKYIETKAGLKYIENATNKTENANVYMLHLHQFQCRYYIDTKHVSERIKFINSSDFEVPSLMLSHLPHKWIKATDKSNVEIGWIYDCKGKNWFMLSNNDPASSAKILHIADSLGYKKLDEYDNSGVRAYLYDCGE
ncbi:MAG: glycosyltransferase family 39 protein [Dysgonamonadaceae bacterium]|jgi:hypothetical protein|nr:glycosyltransferase family 39 protein [Dysgonamonadaceae bacterium]